MEMSQVNCTNCGQPVIVGNEYVREQMFCAIGCMTKFEEKENNKYV